MKTMYLALFLCSQISLCYSQSDQSLVYNNEGVDQMNRRDFSSAIQAFSLAIREDSINSLFFKNRALCYFYNEQYEKSEQNFLQCLALGDEKPEYFYYIGLVRSKMKDNENAINYYGRAIDLDPQSHKYYYHRGICYMKTGSFEDAVSDFHLSIRLNPQHASSYFHRGQSYLMLRNNRAACVDWDVAGELDPQLMPSQYEEFCSGEESTVWHDVKSLTGQERLIEPAFSGKGFDEFHKYFARNTDAPTVFLRRNSNVYGVHRFSVLYDGTIGHVEKILSGNDVLTSPVEKEILKSEPKWNGGSVNGIPADFLYVVDIAFSTSEFINESERLKKMIDEANAEGDYLSALKYCNEILDVYPSA